MLIHTLGTAAGTLPHPGFHHASIAVETEAGLWFFDAGECCAYTAYLAGIDLLKTKAVFLSHPHMDHVGGLGDLLWYIRKSNLSRGILTQADTMDLFTPCRETVDGFLTVLSHTEGGFRTDYRHAVHIFDAGNLYDKFGLRVQAIPTRHMPPENGRAQSFGFRVTDGEKSIVYSGDMRLEDVPALLSRDCDAFLVETGHHQIEDVCRAVAETGKTVGTLCFVHHGAYIQLDPESAQKRANAAFGGRVVIAKDGASFEV